MNKRVKQLWIEALRSGEYSQTKSVLRDTYGFCCLGVLCDLHRIETEGDWATSEDGGYYYGHQAEVMPIEVMEWAGLQSANPDVDDDDTSLAGLNDDGLPFSQIADLIEQQL